MLRIRRRLERGHVVQHWLESYHTFSFAGYQNPQHIRFRTLRVMNEDFIAPGQGFGMHPHRDMEIITYVLSGELAHRDSLGHTAVLRPGELQRMSAGTGIEHSEFNPSPTEPVHLYQIWIFPREKGGPPSYEQKTLPAESRRNCWQVAASPEPQCGELLIQQDARILLAELDPQVELAYDIAPGRHVWLQVLSGTIQLEGQLVEAGDGVAVSEQNRLAVQATAAAELMLFDLN